MRIVDLEVHASLSQPRDRPLRDALQVLSGGGHVTVRLRTDSGEV